MRSQRVFVVLLLGWQFTLTSLITWAGWQDRLLATMAGMLWGINIFWIGGAGALSIWIRDPARSVLQRSPRLASLKFVLFATALALIEEGITTLMTNCAPLFGAAVGEAYVTASANYLDVVFCHSVVVLLPQLAALGWLLARYKLSPFAAFLLLGATGLVDESLFAGPQWLGLAQWILVYGLMAYLPAYCCYATSTSRRPPRWWTYPAIVALNIFASLPAVALLRWVVAPGHPRIHFPPIGQR